jgi:O-antigen ligase
MSNHCMAARTGRISALVLFVAIAAAPFPFGSRNAPTIALWCVLLGLGLLFASVRPLRSGHLALLAGIGLILASYGFVLHEQLATHPWIASPNSVWAGASEALARPLEPSVSIVRGEPFYALGAPLANILALMLGLIVGADRDRAHRALAVMAWSGAVYAAYGIFSLLVTPDMILWAEKTAYLGNLTSTFVNRNTAATYFGSVAVVWFILLLTKIRSRLPRGPIVWTMAPRRLLMDVQGLEGIVVRLSVLMVCLAAMFMTTSRAGSLVSLLVLVLAFVAFSRSDLPRGKGLIVSLVGASLLFLFMGGNVSQRLGIDGFSDANRLATYHSTLQIIADNPWFGTGLGTFPWAYPAYRSPTISMLGVWDLAHSTPLEFAAELGIPLTAMVALGWVVIFVVLIRGLRHRRRDAVVPLAALAVSLIALLHSTVDFSLQISGYSIVVFALVGLGLAQSFPSAASADDLPPAINPNSLNRQTFDREASINLDKSH